MQRKKVEFERGEKGEMLMTPHNIRLFCIEDELYEYPDLNSKIYLHYKGFTKIQNLDAYTNLVSLWLENNCIKKIEGLDKLTKLRTLFLQNNLIEKIEGLEPVKGLKILNLAHNRISLIEGLDVLPELENLDISNNLINKSENLQGMISCQSITNISLIGNQIEGADDIIELFRKMTNIACIYLKGNPCVGNIRNYRKRFICSLPELKYLDGKFIFLKKVFQIDLCFRKKQDYVMLGHKVELKQKYKKDRKWHRKKGIEIKNMLRIQLKKEMKFKSIFFYQLLKYQRRKQQMIEEAKRQSEAQQQSIRVELASLPEINENSLITKEVLQSDLLKEEQKLSEKEKEIQQQLHPLTDPYQSYNFTREIDGTIVVYNKTEEQAEIIKKKIEESDKIKNQIIEEQKNLLKSVRNELQESELVQAKQEEQEVQEEQRKEQSQYIQLNIEELLEALLERYSFNFEQVTEEINKIIVDMNSKQKTNFKQLKQEEIQEIWTKQELLIRERFKENQKKQKITNLEEID